MLLKSKAILLHMYSKKFNAFSSQNMYCKYSYKLTNSIFKKDEKIKPSYPFMFWYSTH